MAMYPAAKPKTAPTISARNSAMGPKLGVSIVRGAGVAAAGFQAGTATGDVSDSRGSIASRSGAFRDDLTSSTGLSEERVFAFRVDWRQLDGQDRWLVSPKLV